MRNAFTLAWAMCLIVAGCGNNGGNRDSAAGGTGGTAESDGGGVVDAQVGVETGGVQKANIIFVLTDDLSCNLVQYMPHVVQMQKQGTTFSHYFVTRRRCE